MSNKTIPEVDSTYLFGKSIAAELILTYPQSLDVELSGTTIGTSKALRPGREPPGLSGEPAGAAAAPILGAAMAGRGRSGRRPGGSRSLWRRP